MKLNHETKKLIKRRLMNGEKQKNLAKEYGVTQPSISLINKNVRTRRVEKNIDYRLLSKQEIRDFFKPMPLKLTEDDVTKAVLTIIRYIKQ